MRIMNLVRQPAAVYTSNVYLLLGDWSALSDVNTLVDVGNDPSVLEHLLACPTGVGKKAVEQVIFTHSHFDHTALLPQVRRLYAPVVYAFSSSIGADVVMSDGQEIKCGDSLLQVIHAPGHSDDSVCLYCAERGILFSGDAPLAIRSADQAYDQFFVAALERLAAQEIDIVYPGHGEPLTGTIHLMLQESLRNVRLARTPSNELQSKNYF